MVKKKKEKWNRVENIHLRLSTGVKYSTWLCCLHTVLQAYLYFYMEGGIARLAEN